LDASSSLARHMLALMKHRRFGDRKSVAAWCRENIEVSIEWFPSHVTQEWGGLDHGFFLEYFTT